MLVTPGPGFFVLVIGGVIIAFWLLYVCFQLVKLWRLVGRRQ